jgi:hypothetical protein
MTIRSSGYEMCVFCVCKTHRFSLKKNLRVFSAKNTRVFFWTKITHVLYRQSLLINPTVYMSLHFYKIRWFIYFDVLQ